MTSRDGVRGGCGRTVFGTGDKDVFNKVQLNTSPFGVAQVCDATDDECYGFFSAASEFVRAAPWLLLGGTRSRQFGCSFVGNEAESECESFVGVSQSLSPSDPVSVCTDDVIKLFDTVVIKGLTSDAGRLLNGKRGEVVPPAPPPPLDGNEETKSAEHQEGVCDGDIIRWRVRLFDGGRIVRVRPVNVAVQADGDDFVVKVHGPGSPVGVSAYKSWTAMYRHHGQTLTHGDSPPTADGPGATFVVTVEFKHFKPEDERTIPWLTKDETLRRRLHAPKPPGDVDGTSRGLAYQGLFPCLFGQSVEGRRLTPVELRIAEAALRAAVDFVRLLSEHPVPHLPYFSPLSFEPRREVLSFRRVGENDSSDRKKKGKGKKGRARNKKNNTRGVVRVRYSFPSGNLAPCHYPWFSYPTVVMRFAPRCRLTIRNVEEAIQYHRAEVEKLDEELASSGCTWQSAVLRGDYRGFAHRFGLAHALREAEEKEGLLESLRLALDLLDADPDDSNRVKRFALDVSIEAGNWESVVELLSRFPDEPTEDWAWTTVLIYLKGRRPEAKSAVAALRRAVKLNEAVYHLLVGDRIVESDEYERCRNLCYHHLSYRYAEDKTGNLFGLPDNAVMYFITFGKYFQREPSTVKWLRDQKRCLSEENAGTSDTVGNDSQPSWKNDLESEGLSQTPFSKGGVGRIDEKLRCASCGNVDFSKSLHKCKGCQSVSYCGHECQSSHWKEHKKACRQKTQLKNRSSRVEQAGRTGGVVDEQFSHPSVVDEQFSHPSWARLSSETRSNLIRFHREARGAGEGVSWRPWPVTNETPAMLNYPMYSFLTMHPDMRFSACIVLFLPRSLFRTETPQMHMCSCQCLYRRMLRFCCCARTPRLRAR